MFPRSYFVDSSALFIIQMKIETFLSVKRKQCRTCYISPTYYRQSMIQNTEHKKLMTGVVSPLLLSPSPLNTKRKNICRNKMSENFIFGVLLHHRKQLDLKIYSQK